MAHAVASALWSRLLRRASSTPGQEWAATLSPPTGVTTFMVHSWVHSRTGMLPPYPAPGTAKSPVRRMDGAPAVATAHAAGWDQWWPWPLVISLNSSAVGLGIWFPSP